MQDENQPPFDIELNTYRNGNEAMVRIKISDEASTHHKPSTLVLVIDESGSMNSQAKTAGDAEGGSGLSVLDVVKHASKTVLQTLHEYDSLGIVAFSDTANVVLPITKMTQENKNVADQAIDSLYPKGCTNLYDGLLKAMEMVKADKMTNATILLLTDGMPNVSPPRGERETLERYLDQNPGLDCRISTFGFGYSLDSELLHDLAVIGKSSYAFIPDSSFVGTIFINAAANILSTSISDAKLNIEATGSAVVTADDYVGATKTSWGLSIELPPLLYGETYDLFLNIKGGGELVATLNFDGRKLESTETKLPEAIEAARAHDAVVSYLYECLKGKDMTLQSCNQSLEKMKSMVDEVYATNPVVEGLKGDVDGQITEAFSRADWYSRWGKHYLLSLARTHALRFCLNFKDPGPQIYGTEKFVMIRDAAEDLFLKLPPPKPSHTPTIVLTSMNMYYDSNNPCFAAGKVLLASGGLKDVHDIRKGDLVQTIAGPKHVICVVETKVSRGFEGLVKLNDEFILTPWHPIRPIDSDAWVFPSELQAPAFIRCHSLFSFVVEDGESLLINGYEAVSLGHCKVGDTRIEHEYLGTEAVLTDLRKMNGWKQGYVSLGVKPIHRNPDTKRVSKMEQKV